MFTQNVFDHIRTCVTPARGEEIPERWRGVLDTVGRTQSDMGRGTRVSDEGGGGGRSRRGCQVAMRIAEREGEKAERDSSLRSVSLLVACSSSQTGSKLISAK
jgi:hypothetical protein